MLTVSSINVGKLGADVRPMDIVPALVEQLRESSEQQPGRRVEFEPPASPVRVIGDPLRVRQVVANLVGNACMHSDPGEPVTVSLEIRGELAIVSVADRGEGIPLADQDRIFERFHRVDNTSTRRTGGTGLGLYIARHLVEAMAGRLRLESEVGRGSRFSFSLPLASAETDAATDALESRSSHRDAG